MAEKHYKLEDDDEIIDGSRIILPDNRTGVVKFVGPVHFMAGIAYGVKLDKKYVGDNDGSVQSWKYFDAEGQRGLFVERAKLRLGDDPHSIDDSVPPTEDDSYELERGLELPEEYSVQPSEEEEFTGEETHDEDPKKDRENRGKVAALKAELPEEVHDPEEDDHDVAVFYLLRGLPYDEIKKVPEEEFQNAIADNLPMDVDPNKIELTFEDLGDDKTEMKAYYDDKMPAEKADDMQWSMLDPIHVRHFNEQLSKKDDTDLIVCEYTYLERRHQDSCCTWVKPCLACVCCWLVLLTIFLLLLWLEAKKLRGNVDDFEPAMAFMAEAPGNETLVCTDFDYCEQIQQDKDDIAGLKDQVADDKGKIQDDTDDIDQIKAGMAIGNGKKVFGVTSLKVEKKRFGGNGNAVVRCPSEDYELVSCWVYLDVPEDQYRFFEFYTDPDPKGYPDCSCYCTHIDKGESACKGECRVQCATYGVTVEET